MDGWVVYWGVVIFIYMCLFFMTYVYLGVCD